MMGLTDRWRTASRTQRMVLIGLAAAIVTVLASVPAALTSSTVDTRLDETESRLEDEIDAATADLQSRLDETSAENERLRTELATIVALLEQVPELGDRIAEVREMQARDLAGEDDIGEQQPAPPRGDGRNDPPGDDSDPDPDPDPDPSPEPSPSPDPDPEPDPDPLPDLLDDLLDPDTTSSRRWHTHPPLRALAR